jgi:hypothetical protein
LANAINGWRSENAVRRLLNLRHGQGILTEAMACGENPTFKPFPEADYQPRT